MSLLNQGYVGVKEKRAFSFYRSREEKRGSTGGGGHAKSKKAMLPILSEITAFARSYIDRLSDGYQALPVLSDSTCLSRRMPQTPTLGK